MSEHFDVVVVGGGTAGLSGALTLARARRSVLVVDAGQPRNAPAAGVHGFLTRDGIPPLEVVARGREEVRGYGGVIREGRVTAAAPHGAGFAVTLDDGATVVTARRLLIATGLIDELPDIPGLRERWGRDVLHCPYCHGWEIRDQRLGVLATGAQAIHQALLFRQWSADLTLFANDLLDEPVPPGLAARGIAVVTGRVAALEADGLRMASGDLHPIDALALMPRFVARTDGLDGLGLTTSEHPFGVGLQIDTDDGGLQSTVPGVYVAGNAGDVAAGVVTAADQGVRAAATMNHDLVLEDTAAAEAT